ncbi:unnamed protein product [Sphagnum jensenii]|uniref:Pentatricopeptide repeat-containing protein n=1 Tax=Sphagnum jensenii TaxID=128206 RepID=A0ABP1B4K5_9BRYO
MEEAQRVFNKMPSLNVVSWDVMILAHMNCGQGQEALELFRQMQQEGVQPNPVTFVAVLNACTSIIAIEEGRRAHEQIIHSGCEADVFVGNSLIDMYAKCGSMEDAQRVFKVVSWTAMLQGFAMHGYGKEALEHFEQTGENIVEVNDVTFICLLSACSHAGLVDEAVGIHGNMEMGEHITTQVLEIYPENPPGYVLLSNIYTAAGKQDLRGDIQQQRKERGVKNNWVAPGLTRVLRWIHW